jgi:hypothetical protein
MAALQHGLLLAVNIITFSFFPGPMNNPSSKDGCPTPNGKIMSSTRSQTNTPLDPYSLSLLSTHLRMLSAALFAREHLSINLSLLRFEFLSSLNPRFSFYKELFILVSRIFCMYF